MINTLLGIGIGISIGIAIAVPFTILFYTIKNLKKDIKGFYEREKEYTKTMLDMIKSYGLFMDNVKKNIEEMKNSFPTPEEVAQEVLKAKIPVESLPPDMQEQYKNMNKVKKGIQDDRSYLG